MNTLANVGTTINSLWWALNGVNLLFACSKCGTTVRENPYTDMILLKEKSYEFNNKIYSILLTFIFQFARGFYGLKYVHSVISVIVHSLPGNNKNQYTGVIGSTDKTISIDNRRSMIDRNSP